MGIARQWNTTTNCVATVAMYRPSGEFQINIPPKVYFDEISQLSDSISHGNAPSLQHSTIAQESMLHNLPSYNDKSKISDA
uniref:Uncharacterized protein n=1 Tax=Onchocerca volvulus TaxID=6282 RepID=A0A8R1XNK2_ONCVO